MIYHIINTPIGEFTAAEDMGAIVRLSSGKAIPDDAEVGDEPLFEKLERELDEYLSLKRVDFTVPALARGTEFQKRCWNAIRMIPYGETMTYAELAMVAGKPDAARAAGAACRENPVLILIPCHRVIGSDGSLTGYAAGLELKERLLKLEKEGK